MATGSPDDKKTMQEILNDVYDAENSALNTNASVSGTAGVEYNATPPTLTNGGTDSAQSDVNGNMKVVLATGIDSTVDSISAKLATDAIMNDNTELVPKFAIIDAASSGDNTLLAAVTGKKIRVTALYLVSAGTVNVRFESGAGGTALSGQMNLVANTGFVLPFNPTGWFETASATLLNLELSAAVSVDGGFQYIEV